MHYSDPDWYVHKPDVQNKSAVFLPVVVVGVIAANRGRA